MIHDIFYFLYYIAKMVCASIFMILGIYICWQMMKADRKSNIKFKVTIGDTDFTLTFATLLLTAILL